MEKPRAQGEERGLETSPQEVGMSLTESSQNTQTGSGQRESAFSGAGQYDGMDAGLLTGETSVPGILASPASISATDTLFQAPQPVSQAGDKSTAGSGSADADGAVHPGRAPGSILDQLWQDSGRWQNDPDRTSREREYMVRQPDNTVRIYTVETSDTGEKRYLSIKPIPECGEGDHFYVEENKKDRSVLFNVRTRPGEGRDSRHLRSDIYARETMRTFINDLPEPPETIIGRWSPYTKGTNYSLFMDRLQTLTGRKISHKNVMSVPREVRMEAARATWTGTMANELGFAHVADVFIDKESAAIHAVYAKQLSQESPAHGVKSWLSRLRRR